MSRLEKLKQNYEAIPIPEELAVRVRQEIDKSRKKHRPSPAVRVLRFAGAAAAAAGVVFTLALNTIPAFALEAAQLPVIGSVARVLTFRSYETEQDGIRVAVEIPSIEAIQQDTGLRLDAINQKILNRCTEYADEALARAEEYRAAFLATGGTLEEWAAHDLRITVGYEILLQDETYLSFLIRGSQSWSSAGNETRYCNLDLRTGAEVTLKDLLGEDYESLINTSIRSQIAQREQEGQVFFPADAGGFTGITDSPRFYLSPAHNPVIVFEKFEIANGAAGEIAFEITPVSLEALLGADYAAQIEETVTMQMENRMEKNPEVSYYPITGNSPLSSCIAIDEIPFEVDGEGYLTLLFPAGTVTDEGHGTQAFRIRKV